MQTLGLSSESKRADGRLKSLLWPAWRMHETLTISVSKAWICMIVAVSALVISVPSGKPVVIFMGVLSALFYLLGGMGVRQGNWPAAAMVLVVYTLGIVVQTASSSLPSIFMILFAVVLLSNLRATFLASEWKPAAEGEDQPTRFNETLADKFVDQLPAKLWPILQIPFLILGNSKLLFVLTVFGFAIAHRFGLVPHQ